MNLRILSLIYTEWPTILILSIIAYVVHFYFQYFFRENALPGPIPLPIIGNLHILDRDLAVFSEKIREKYGDLSEVYFGRQKYIFVSRADLLDKIYGNSSSSGKNAFVFRTPPSEGLDELEVSYKGILFNRNVDLWKFNRKFVSQTIMSPRFLKQFVKSVQELFNEVERYWNILSEDEETREIQFATWTKVFATDITISVTTGKNVFTSANYFNSIVKNEQKKIKHPETIFKKSKELVDSVLMRARASLFFLIVPSFMRHNFPILSQFNQSHMDNLRWLENKLMEFVSEGKKKVEKAKNNEELEPNILTLLLTTNTEKDLNKITTGEFSRSLTDNEIVSNFLEVFSAGINTTANLLCTIVYYIDHNPEVKRKLLQELESLNLSSPDQEIPYDKVDNLKYLEAVINETSRLQPPIPVFFRCSTEETTFANVKIPENSTFFTNFMGLHRNPLHWERPLEFDPDRFYLNKDKIVRSSHLPFGGGMRYCPGRHWAMIEMKAFMAKLYLKYDVELVDKNAPLKVLSRPLAIVNDLKVLIKPKKK